MWRGWLSVVPNAAITWPQSLLCIVVRQVVAAQVNGNVGRREAVLLGVIKEVCRHEAGTLQCQRHPR